jgi:hypothetical protein
LLLTLAARASASGVIDDAAAPVFSDPEAERIAAAMALDLAAYAGMRHSCGASSCGPR